MADWGNGLDWDPASLAQSAQDIRARSTELKSVRGNLEAARPAGWTGPAQIRAGIQREKLVKALDISIHSLDRVAPAYDHAAGGLRPIKSSMGQLQDYAARNQFSINRSGWVTDNRGLTDLGRYDPRRGYARAKLATNVGVVCVRLTAMDVRFSAELQLALANAVLDTVQKTFDELGQLADSIWDKEVEERLRVFGLGMARYLSAVAEEPRWVRDLRDGKLPQLSEVLGQGLYEAGLLAGAGWNLVSGEDKHLFDDGVPYTGPVVTSHEQPNINGPSGLMREMSDIYKTSSDDDRNDRPDVKVTVIEGQPPRYIVTIPGTTIPLSSLDGYTGNNEGTDWPANLKGVGYGSTASTQAVMDAIDKVRQQRGDTTTPEVLLTGHSQGGIIAANIAADPGFNSRYKVDGIMSAGSPVNTIPIPKDVAAINFANAGDAVPKLDLDDWGGRRQQSVDEIPLDVPEDKRSTTYSHEPAIYQQNIDAIMHKADTGQPLTADEQKVVDWQNKMAKFNTDGQTATSYTVEVGRTTRR